MGFPGGLAVKNPPANAGDLGSMPGWGSSLREGNDMPFPSSYQDYPMDRGAWRATVPRVVESDTT